MKKPCSVYEKELNKTYFSPHLERINSEHAELYSYLTQHSGKKIDSVLGVEMLYNTLEIEVRAVGLYFVVSLGLEGLKIDGRNSKNCSFAAVAHISHIKHRGTKSVFCKSKV